MKNKSLILGLIFFAIVAGVIYLGNKQKVVPVETQDVVSVETGDWETYENSDYQLSFQYPAKFGFDLTQYSEEMVALLDFTEFEPLRTPMIVSIKKLESDKAVFSADFPEELLSQTKVEIGGREGMQYIYRGTREGYPLREYVVANGEYIFSFEFYLSDWASTIDHIISTIAFPGASSASEKTYSNSQYGFEVTYPKRYDVSKQPSLGSDVSLYFTDNSGAADQIKQGLGGIVVYKGGGAPDAFHESNSVDLQKIDWVGRPAYEGVGQDIEGFHYVFTVANNGYVFEIMTGLSTHETLAEVKADLTEDQKQFVASFKFTK